ncbi:MAG TPA: hypothetical protein VLA44_12090, partial [Clostridia bacterium]|nr:hypothetical protein [Clostridia bacterium]
MLFFAWGFAEGTVAPVVPDVGLGLLALATPAALAGPLIAAVCGGVAGGLLLALVARARPAVVRRIVVAQPGLGAAGLAATHRRLERLGAVRGFGQVGPGAPLKAYVAALLEQRPSAALSTVTALAMLNRATRLGPVVAAFAILGAVLRPLELATAPLVVAYCLGWAAFLAVFW